MLRGSCLFSAWWVASLIAVDMAIAARAPKPEYITDGNASPIVFARQAWGQLGLDTAVRPAGKPAARLRIKDRHFARGLGHHANGEVVVALEGRYAAFETEIGIQWQGGKTRASVVFQIYVDGEKRFDSGVKHENDPPQAVHVPVAGATELRLVVEDGGDGILCDCADWADARLYPDSAAAAPREPMVDSAQFARVMTWDPARQAGTAAGRTEEFPAADVVLAQDVHPDERGNFAVPKWPAGVGCIGLRWRAQRFPRKLVLRFADAAKLPAAQNVRVECFVGASPWQGAWQPLRCDSSRSGDRWVWRLGYRDLPHGTEKIRWIFSAMEAPIVLRDISAYPRVLWKTAAIRVEAIRAAAGQQARITVHNGALINGSGAAPQPHDRWNLGTPRRLNVRYGYRTPCQTEQTVLRFALPGVAFAVAVDDVLRNDCVYVPEAGVFVTRDPAPVTPAAYLEKIAGKQTVLERVRRLPDQSFRQAMAKVHHAFQDLGPMLLSLACDNRKFMVHRDGTISFRAGDRPDGTYPPVVWRMGLDVTGLDCQQLRPTFGTGTQGKLSRHLDGGWLPMPVTTIEQGNIVYRQRTYVAPMDDGPPAGGPRWLRRRALCVAEFTVENKGHQPAAATWSLALVANAKRHQPATCRVVPEGVLAMVDQRLFALVDTAAAGPLRVSITGGTVTLAGRLPGKATAHCFVYLPAWRAREADCEQLRGGLRWAERTQRYWQELFAPATQIAVPDTLLTNIIRASQVHCMLAARNEEAGQRIAPWVASDRYGPLESEGQAVIRAMDMMGHRDFARRSLAFFIHRYRPAGYLTTGYTIVGTGENLWTLAEHFHRTGDRAWLRTIAPEVSRVCHWVMRQIDKTKRLDSRGRKRPEYGLMTPGVSADWARYAYRFFNDAQYCAGLRMAGAALAEVHTDGADEIVDAAARYRQDVRRAYRWARARTPVVPLRNGCWVPAYPPMLFCLGDPASFYPGEDANRSWCYGIELGAHHLAVNGVLDPHGNEVSGMIDHLEDVQFLRTGMRDYPAAENHKDFFDFGGFSKVQPYYCRIAELHALRDEVKPFLRSYFNAIPTLLSAENLSFWEHFHNTAGWNKTHETAWFLCQTRLMLVMERGDTLWLAPMVTTHWLDPGMNISVRNMPTNFGPVSFSITSAIDHGKIEATVRAPMRAPPRRIVLRLRHPRQKPIRAVTVNGRPHTEFDAAAGTIRLVPTAPPIRVQAMY